MEPTLKELEGRFWSRIEPIGTPFRFQYNHTYDGQHLRAVKKQGPSSSRAQVLAERTNNEDAAEEEGEEEQQQNQGKQAQSRTTSFPSMDHRQMLSLTWDQRNKFLQEFGDYVGTRVKSEFEAQTKAWTEEVADCVLNKLGDILPGYIDYMAHRSQQTQQVKVDFLDFLLFTCQIINFCFILNDKFTTKIILFYLRTILLVIREWNSPYKRMK